MKTKFLKVGMILSLIVMLNSCFMIYRPKKPFIIYGKEYQSNRNLITYKYYDSHGNSFYFEDSVGKYKIGDSIK